MPDHIEYERIPDAIARMQRQIDALAQMMQTVHDALEILCDEHDERKRREATMD